MKRAVVVTLTIAMSLAVVCGTLMAAGVDYIQVAINGPRHSGPIATKYIIFGEPDTTYEVRITICEPKQNGCILHRAAVYATTDNLTGHATAVFNVPPSQIEDEEITATPCEKCQ